jgi:protein-L-isoaspartate(D-aspartate) O-methyltransferase
MEDQDDRGLTYQRRRMVQAQLRARGIKDPRVLDAMETVPRHLFIAPNDRWSAYQDSPLPIGEGQTISQPYMVARMTELLALDETAAARGTVLEIGTGSGYQTAVLAELVHEVWSVERFPELAVAAREVLSRLRYSNVHVIVGDGTLGLPEQAPFQGIIVTAAAPYVPPVLTEQLDMGASLVIPVGDRESQWLRVIVRTPEGLDQQDVLECRFVPLIGAQGYPG